MKRSTGWRLFAALSAAVLLGPSANADTLRQIDLPPQAGLVVHVDIEEWSNNELSSQMVKDLLGTEYLRKQLESIPDDLAPLLEDLPAGITWVMATRQEIGLAVFSNANSAPLIDSIQQAPSYVDLDYRGMKIHHWQADLHSLANHFNQGEPKPRKDDDDEIVSFYMAVAGDGHLALSNDLRMLVEWIERVTGTGAAMSDEEFASRFQSDHAAPLLTVNQNPAAVDEEADSELPFRSISAFIWADDKIHASANVDLGSESMATMVAQMGQPETLSKFFVQMAQQVKRGATPQGSDSADSSNDEPENDPYENSTGETPIPAESDEAPNGTIQFGVGFRGMNTHLDEEPNESEIKEFFASTSQVSSSGSVLKVKWSGHARLVYEHRFENGQNDHVFHAWLGERSEDTARLAERPDDRQDRR